MAKHQIKHCWRESIIFECDVPDDMESGLRTRDALEQAANTGANLTYANLSGANLSGANLSGANLSGANLSEANLSEANLTYADLTEANLSEANLSEANLTYANLSEANLTYANLSEANLTYANLTEANLTGASLTGASLTGAKWRNGVVINKQPIQLFGLRWCVTILDEHMQIGCELHKLSDWAIYDDARIAEMDGREAFLRFWRASKRVLLGLAKSAGRCIEEAQPETVEA